MLTDRKRSHRSSLLRVRPRRTHGCKDGDVVGLVDLLAVAAGVCCSCAARHSKNLKCPTSYFGPPAACSCLEGDLFSAGVPEGIWFDTARRPSEHYITGSFR